VLIDPFRFARSGDLLERTFSLLPEGRLEGIVSGQTDICLKIQGNTQDWSRPVLEGQIQGFVKRQCQVCLQELQIPLDISFRVAPVTSEEQALGLRQDLEPIVIIDNSLALGSLVNDEVILALPATTSHWETDGEECVKTDAFSIGDIPEQTKVSPFAVLKSVKQKDC